MTLSLNPISDPSASVGAQTNKTTIVKEGSPLTAIAKKTRIFTPHIPGRYLPTLAKDAPYPRLAVGVFTSLLLFFIASSGAMYRYDMGHVHPAGRSAGRSMAHVGHVSGDMRLNRGLAQLGYFDRRDIEESGDGEERPDRFLNDYQDDGGFRQASINEDNGNDRVQDAGPDSDSDSVSDSGLSLARGRGRGRDRMQELERDMDQSFGYMGAGPLAYPSEPADSHDMAIMSSSTPTPVFGGSAPSSRPRPTMNRRQTDPSAAPVPIAESSSSSSSSSSPSSSSSSPSSSPTPTPIPNSKSTPTKSAPHTESTFRNADDVRDPTAVKPDSDGMSMESKDADGMEPTSSSSASASGQAPAVAVASAPTTPQQQQQQPEARHWSSRKRGINAGTQIQKGQREKSKGRGKSLGSKKITITPTDDE